MKRDKQFHLRLRPGLSVVLILAVCLLAIYLYGLYNPSIPILTYHHINEHEADMVTISPQDFEKQMAYIKDNFNTVHLGELLPYIKNKKRFPPRTCVITFDDGYYDNLVYAYPVLKKYKLKATIFVISSRIGEKRRTYEIKNHHHANLEASLAACAGKPSEHFLTWHELKEMQESGVIDIQSHTLTHACYFVSPKICGFNNGDFPWWLPLANGGDIRLGIPVYEDQKALLALRYFDDKSLRNYLAQYVEDRGGEKFFASRGREEQLKELSSVVDEYIAKHGSLKGNFENEIEKRIRLRAELYLSKRDIEERLNKKCLFISWPWGRYNEELVTLARSYGYQGATTTEKGANTCGIDPMCLKRFDIKTGNIRWFKARLFMYNHGIIARFYPIVRGK